MEKPKPKYKLDYHVRGRGPTVILIHGMGASRYDWEALVPELVSAGYRTYTVDLLGHGSSPRPDASDLYTVESIYGALEDWIDRLSAPGPYHLIGHSLGGYLSLEYSLSHQDEISAITLIAPLFTPNQISPVLRYLSRSPKLGIKLLPLIPVGWIEKLLGWDSITSSQFTPEIRLQIAMDIKRASPLILYIPSSVSDLTPKLAQVQQPSQVIWGNKDLTLAPETYPSLVASLPNVTENYLPGSGHQPHIGAPEKVNPLILDFVDQHSLVDQ
jgi:pimeloyl-ACP methyl ester carboxylesterase